MSGVRKDGALMFFRVEKNPLYMSMDHAEGTAPYWIVKANSANEAVERLIKNGKILADRSVLVSHLHRFTPVVGVKPDEPRERQR